MSHSIEFLKDEVRNGFYISTPVKQAWAETLDVLGEIDRICRKHDIRYFADWGTFLGAVRHGGFVPWDDDLDICMLRDDYTKFRQVADKELPSHFTIHDYVNKKDHWLFLSRVVNNTTMCFDEAYLETHNNFPWLAGIDIFVKDYLYDSDEDEIARDKEILNILAVADGIRDGSLGSQSIITEKERLQKKYNVSLPEGCKGRDLAVALYALAEQQMARVKPEESHRVGQIFPWIIKLGPNKSETKETYENIVYLPFEDTKVPVPAAYNRSLLTRYGDNYCMIKKVWDGHDYPFFEGQKAEMEKLSGERFPGFYFDRSMLIRCKTDRSSSLKETARECLNELDSMLESAEAALLREDYEVFTGLIVDSQQLVADLGTLIEQTKGESAETTLRITGALQGYCDALWEEYQFVANGENKDKLTASRDALQTVKDVIKKDLSDRKEVLFLTIGEKEWKSFERYYNQVSDEDTDIYVVRLPLMRKSFSGAISDRDTDLTEGSDPSAETVSAGIKYTDHRLYDPAIHCPDEIYVQYPYDGYNPCMTVPPEFFVRNLQKYSDKIIYVPAYKTGEFGPEDKNDIYHLKHYAASPVVVYADEVIVQSENIKDRYVEALCRFAGEDTEKIWTYKIHAEVCTCNEAPDRKEKKFLFCIGENELAEHKDHFTDALKNKFEIIDRSKDKIRLYLTLYPEERVDWTTVDSVLKDKVFKMLEGLISEGKAVMVDYKAADADEIAGSFDAYYGSPSPLVAAFITRGKPVMLADYDL